VPPRNRVFPLNTIYCVPHIFEIRYSVRYLGETTLSTGRTDTLTSHDFLDALHHRGAKRIRHVRFRNNRSTVWSLTQRGTVLNVHAAYRKAPARLLDSFATLAIEGGVGSPASRHAARELSEWPDVARAIRTARDKHAASAERHTSGQGPDGGSTPQQQAYLRALYRYFNRTRFGNKLPHDIPLRISHRMKSALGHVLPGARPDGSRYVVELALNVDLLLAANGAERVDTLLHEMAHVADYLESGNRGHGRSWREWARRVGCQPTTLYERPVVYRVRRRDKVTRIPPLPSALYPDG
jgi:hypothetical protein